VEGRVEEGQSRPEAYRQFVAQADEVGAINLTFLRSLKMEGKIVREPREKDRGSGPFMLEVVRWQMESSGRDHAAASWLLLICPT
jgi:hypothetical protein